MTDLISNLQFQVNILECPQFLVLWPKLRPADDVMIWCSDEHLQRTNVKAILMLIEAQTVPVVRVSSYGQQ